VSIAVFFVRVSCFFFVIVVFEVFFFFFFGLARRFAVCLSPGRLFSFFFFPFVWWLLCFGCVCLFLGFLFYMVLFCWGVSPGLRFRSVPTVWVYSPFLRLDFSAFTCPSRSLPHSDPHRETARTFVFFRFEQDVPLALCRPSSSPLMVAPSRRYQFHKVCSPLSSLCSFSCCAVVFSLGGCRSVRFTSVPIWL